MSYQIDQSGKIEDTAKNTVLGLSNGKQKTVFISKKTKRQLQELFRRHGLIKLFTYQIFSIGIFYLIKDLKILENICIDLEYPKKDKIIRSIVANLLLKFNKPNHHITFARIGNRPKVHYTAKNVFDKKVKPDKVVSLKEILEVIKKTDGHLRECITTLVDVQPRSYKQNIAKKSNKVKKSYCERIMSLRSVS